MINDPKSILALSCLPRSRKQADILTTLKRFHCSLSNICQTHICGKRVFRSNCVASCASNCFVKNRVIKRNGPYLSSWPISESSRHTRHVTWYPVPSESNMSWYHVILGSFSYKYKRIWPQILFHHPSLIVYLCTNFLLSINSEHKNLELRMSSFEWFQWQFSTTDPCRCVLFCSSSMSRPKDKLGSK